jgi:sugar lactone lactonase YvrE
MSSTVPRFTDFEIAVLPTAQLGEGPRWDAATATLLWVDVPLKTVHRYDPVTGKDVVHRVSDVVSLALPRRRGGVVVGLPDGLHVLNGEQSMGLVAIDCSPFRWAPWRSTSARLQARSIGSTPTAP